jgi:predicted DsbA family dithiol-disulfide isomerase
LGKSSELKEALMKAYFTDGIDLSKEENVLKVIENCDLDTLEAESILKSNQFSNEVDEDIYHASQIGVRGVPFFVLNNQFAISGAQEDSVFENTLKKLNIQ